MQSFTDYVSAEIYFNNMDWGCNNMSMWKSSVPDSSNPYADGKWHFILFDTEYCQDPYNKINPPEERDSLNEFLKNNSDSFVGCLMKSVMENEDFREQFCRTFMDMANNNFDYLRVSRIIDKFSAEYHDAIIDTYKRFPSKTSDEDNAEKIFSDAVDSVNNFYKNRYPNIVKALKNNFFLKGSLANITIKNNDPMRKVTINTITPDLSSGSWSGNYYTDFPVSVSAKPESGYKFSHWEVSDGSMDESESTSISFTSDITITAVYEKFENLMGDVNLDGSVGMADLVLLQNHILCRTVLSVDQAANADLCGDGVIDSYDQVLLRKLLINQPQTSH